MIQFFIPSRAREWGGALGLQIFQLQNGVKRTAERLLFACKKSAEPLREGTVRVQKSRMRKRVPDRVGSDIFSQNLKETITPYSGMSLYVMSLYVTVGSEHMVPAALRYLVGGNMSWQKFRKLSKEGVKSKKTKLPKFGCEKGSRSRASLC
jgi:hypothetical protein